MATLPETTNVLSELSSDAVYGLGDHTEYAIRTGLAGLPLGDVQFDPSRHSLNHINHLAPLAEATGEYYVRQVLPSRPMYINVVVDGRTGSEHPVIADHKRRASYALSEAIVNSVPGIADHAAQYELVDANDRNGFTSNYEQIVVSGETDASLQVSDLALGGLTFVVSDFKRLSFERVDGQLVAVKLNHPLERALPPMTKGFLSLGGGLEVNMGNAEQVAYVNDRLAAQHEAILSTLRESSAQTASAVAAPKNPDGFLSADVDREIAVAIQTLAHKA